MLQESDKNVAQQLCDILTGRVISGAVKVTKSSDDDTPATGAARANHSASIIHRQMHNKAETRELKTACSHVMLLPQHLCNGLACPICLADESMFAQVIRMPRQSDKGHSENIYLASTVHACRGIKMNGL